MKINQISFSGILAILAFSGCLFLSGCCQTGKKEACCASEAKNETCCASEVKKVWIDPATLHPFMEYDKTTPIIVDERITRRIAYLNDLMIVIVDITGGPQAEPDPFHAHPAEQVCYVADGEVIVTIGEKQQKLKAGDVFIVPGNVPHTVQLLTPTLRLVDTFNPIREDFLSK